jgi:hypothetical protein
MQKQSVSGKGTSSNGEQHNHHQQQDDEKIFIERLAKWLRNSRSSKLQVREGIARGKRVYWFKGCDLVEAIMNGNFSQDSFLKAKITGCDRQKVLEMADLMMASGYFHAAVNNDREKSEKKKSRKGGDLDDQETIIMLEPFHKRHFTEHQPSENVHASSTSSANVTNAVKNEASLYIWLLAEDPFWVYIQSVSLVLFIIFCCCIRIWPIWLKICVWWLSLILLIAMVGVIVLRIVTAVFFFIIGFRGVWLLPNFFDDDIPFFDSMKPLFGKGHLFAFQAFILICWVWTHFPINAKTGPSYPW